MKKTHSHILMTFLLVSSLTAYEAPENPGMNFLPGGLVDTLDLGLNPIVRTGISPGDIVMGLLKVPGDLTLNGVGVDIAKWNTDGFAAELKVEVYRQGVNSYPYNSAGSMYGTAVIGQNGWLGYAHSANDQATAYPDVSSASDLVWNSFSGGTGVCSSEPEVPSGQPVWGAKVLPVGSTDVTVSKTADSLAEVVYADFSGTGGASFLKDEYIAVVISYPAEGAGDPADTASVIELNAVDASYFNPYPGLKYFAASCSGPSGEQGWHVIPETGNFKYLVDITGDIPPVIGVYHVGISSIEGLPDPIPAWTTVKVFTTADDYNPAGGSSGIQSVQINWQLNSLTAKVTSAFMSMAFNLSLQKFIYYADIPGQTNGTTVYWWVSAKDAAGNTSSSPKRSYLLGTSTETSDRIPGQFELTGNYPNPFNPVTTITYNLEEISDVAISVYNIRGQKVRDLFSGSVNSGKHAVVWDGRDQYGQTVSAGIYICHLQAGGHYLTGKMTLLK